MLGIHQLLPPANGKAEQKQKNWAGTAVSIIVIDTSEIPVLKFSLEMEYRE